MSASACAGSQPVAARSRAGVAAEQRRVDRAQARRIADDADLDRGGGDQQRQQVAERDGASPRATLYVPAGTPGSSSAR